MTFVAQAPVAVSTTFTNTGGGSAEANLFDGSDVTPAADPSGLTAATKAAYNLGSPKAITRCRIITAPVNGFTNTATFNIEFSDTSLTTGFTVASTITVVNGFSQLAIKDFAFAGAHPFWRIANPTGVLSGNAWIGELTFFVDTPDTGAFAVTGNAASLTNKALSAAAAYSVTGNAAVFTPKLASNGAAYITAGNAAFRSAFQVTGAAYTFNGEAAPLTPKMNSGTGAFTLTGFATTTLQTWGVSGSSYLIASTGASLTRDFINWLPEPFRGSDWSAVAAQSSPWAPAASPSNAWTVDPAQAIPAPVTEQCPFSLSPNTSLISAITKARRPRAF